MKPETFGEWLVWQRSLRGMTQGDIEAAASIDHAHYSRIENNRVKMPTTPVRARIHRVLNTSDDDLVEAGLMVRRERMDGTAFYEAPPQQRKPVSIVSDIGEQAALAEMVSRLSDEQARQLRLFLETMVER